MVAKKYATKEEAKAARAAQMRARRAAMTEEQYQAEVEAKRAYRASHKEKVAAYNAAHAEDQKAWRAAHIEHEQARAKVYHEAHKEKRNAQSKDNYIANLDQRKADARAYHHEHYVPVPPTKGYTAVDGSFVGVHSMPEAKIAEAFIQAGIEVQRPKVPLNVLGSTYTPDFYLPKYNLFIEVKAIRGANYYQVAKAKQLAKIQYLRSQGYNIAYMAAEDIVAEVA